MPSGALLHLIAIGEQDLFLTGNPEITYFQTIYRRHTNFSIETIDEPFVNSPGFGKTCSCKINQCADLISHITLNVNLGSLNKDKINIVCKKKLYNKFENKNYEINCECQECSGLFIDNYSSFGWINSIGHALIKSTWIEINGQKIDTQYGEWMEIWSELTLPPGKKNGYFKMVGKVESESFQVSTFSDEMQLYVPLQFWFCKNIGMALPMINLYYSDVYIHVDFRKFDQCWVSNVKGVKPLTTPKINATLLIEQILLDYKEREHFYSTSQSYLIEQIQFSGDHSFVTSNGTFDLSLNNPVKEIIWIIQRTDVTKLADSTYPNSNYPKGNDWFNFTNCTIPHYGGYSSDSFSHATISINGLDRMSEMKSSYYKLYQPYYYHSNIPTNNIYIYSYSLKPESYQPSGHLNMSRIHDSKLIIKRNHKQTFNSVLKYYAINYNVLIIVEGMGCFMFYS